MKVKKILSESTIQNLKDKDFYMYNGSQIGCYNNHDYLCWFYGKKRNGNASPTIIIDSESGIIYMKCPTTYFMRSIPDVLIDMIQEGIVAKDYD